MNVKVVLTKEKINVSICTILTKALMPLKQNVQIAVMFIVDRIIIITIIITL